MWRLILLILATASIHGGTAEAQEAALVPDTTLPIPAVHVDGTGALLIEASATSSPHDFDYLVGTWKLKNRKLKSRLAHSTEWIAFESRVEMHQILDGMGNIDKYTDTASGKPYEGVALRLFNPKTRLWSIYWADGNSGTLDPPVVGSFENKVGHFFGRDTFHGKSIVVVFRWDVRNPRLPIWSQAFSTDEGKSWEWNSINVSERAVAPAPQNASLDSAVQFLITSAATDFHTHRPPDPVRFRDVRIGHVTTSSGEAQYRLCGQFLPAQDGGKAEWTAFATIKTSDYEQWLGAQSATYCQGPSFVWDRVGDLASSLQSRLDSLR